MRLTRSEKIWKSWIYIAMITVAIVTVLPVWHVLMQSISRPTAQSGGLYLFPRGFSLAAYKMVIKDPLILSGFKVTIIVTVCGTAINLVISFLGAYPLTRKDLVGRTVIQYLIFFTMLFGGGLIPTYIIVSKLKMVNTYWALIIPGALSPYQMFVLRNFIQNLPESLQESARIDGASEMRVLVRIIIPLSVPVIAVLGLMFGVGHWNSWFSSVIYTTKPSMLSLQAVMRQILMVDTTSQYFANVTEMYEEAAMPKSLQMAIVSVATLPILCVYPFLQKYFVKGIMLGAVKG